MSVQVPADARRDATRAIRGYVHQLVIGLELLFDEAAKDRAVHIEAWEDLAHVGNTSATFVQVKDRLGPFSLSQQPSVEMLDRWAARAMSNPNDLFVFVTTQSPGRLHDSSTAFSSWVAGDRTASTLESLRTSLTTYVAGLSSPLPALRVALATSEAFSSFWRRTEWRADAAGLEQRLAELESRLSERQHLTADTAHERVRGWLGEIATSASSIDPAARIWTWDRVSRLSPQLDMRLQIDVLLARVPPLGRASTSGEGNSQLGRFAWILGGIALGVVVLGWASYPSFGFRPAPLAAPDTEVVVGPVDRVCVLTNADARKLDGVTLAFNFYQVEPSSCRTVTASGSTWASATELLPTTSLLAPLGSKFLEVVLSGEQWRPHPCPGSACHTVIECEARYARSADGKWFKKSGFLVVRSDGSTSPLVGGYSRRLADASMVDDTFPPALSKRLLECVLSQIEGRQRAEAFGREERANQSREEP